MIEAIFVLGKKLGMYEMQKGALAMNHPKMDKKWPLH